MSIPLLGLRSVIYPVADLESATRWWSDLLGMPPYFQEAFYVGFNVAGYELGLLPDQDGDDTALCYWGVVDVDAAVAEALSAGASIHTAASEVGDEIVTATVKAPDGNIVGFIYNPHFTL